MWQILRTIDQHLVMAIPAMMLLGFGFGLLRDPTGLKTLIVPLTFLMVYPMMVTLKIKQVFQGGDLRAQLLSQAINFGVIPFVAFGAHLQVDLMAILRQIGLIVFLPMARKPSQEGG